MHRDTQEALVRVWCGSCGLLGAFLCGWLVLEALVQEISSLLH